MLKSRFLIENGFFLLKILNHLINFPSNNLLEIACNGFEYFRYYFLHLKHQLSFHIRLDFCYFYFSKS